MNKFTPGPWWVEMGQDVMAADGAGQRLICQCHAGHAEERGANARLIAASPLLLERLKLACEVLRTKGEAGIAAHCEKAISEAAVE